METLAVAPIFVSAGAAALPTIVAVVGSVAAILLKPGELLRLSVRRPKATLAVVLAVAVVLLTLTQLLRADAKPRAAAAPAGARIDWSKVALNLIALERAGKEPTALADAAPSGAPIFEGRDASRASFDGGTSPTGLRVRWRFQPEDAMFLGQPVVTAERIFAAANQSDLGGFTGLLACLDAKTGQPLWQVTQIGDEPAKPYFSAPALTADGKFLLIGQGLHQDRDCALLCFEAATGKLKWAAKTPTHVESSPVIFGDVAFVGAGAIEGNDGRAIGDPGFVMAVRISDGKELWRQPVNDAESTPAVDDEGVVYIGSGFNGSAVVAIRGATDELLRDQKLNRVAWRTPTPYPMTGPISIAGDLIIAGGGNGDIVHSNRNARGLVVALDRKTGQQKWQTELEDSVLGAIAVRDGVLICPCRTGEVVALSQADGKPIWRARVSGNSPILAGAAFTGTRVYAVSSDGSLGVIDAKTGAVTEKLNLNDPAKPGTGLTLAAPQVVDGRVIVGSETGGLQCLIGEANP